MAPPCRSAPAPHPGLVRATPRTAAIRLSRASEAARLASGSATPCWRGVGVIAPRRRLANVLLLDEPSNDLDVHTLRALEDALEGFAGAALIISHDRWFLDRVATHMLAFEGDSAGCWFPGNYSEYEADRRRCLGAAADRPRRITCRKLCRA